MTVKDQRLGINRIDDWVNRWPARLEMWNLRYTTRRQLRELPDELLRDIGLDKVDAEQEMKKPFWRK